MRADRKTLVRARRLSIRRRCNTSGIGPPETKRASHIARSTSLSTDDASVFHAFGGLAAWERPRAVRELQHEHAVVLARRPQRPRFLVEMHLRRAPVGTTR